MSRTRRCRGSFVVTMSAGALLEATSCQPPASPPQEPPSRAAEPVQGPLVSPLSDPHATAEPPSPDPKGYATSYVQNPKDARSGRLVVRSESGCGVWVPYDRGPGPQPSGPALDWAAFPCPAAMDDPAWQSCDGYLTFFEEGVCSCLHHVQGNPPGPDLPSPCPSKPIRSDP